MDLLAESLGQHPELDPGGVEDGVGAEAGRGEGAADVGVDDLAPGEVGGVIDGDELEVVRVVLDVLAIGLDVHIQVPVVTHGYRDLVRLAAGVHLDNNR